MSKYIIRRVLTLIPMWFLISFIMFMLLRCSNVSPMAAMLGDKQTSEETIASLIKQFNLDKPLTVQYFIWIKNFIQGNFGIDYKMKESVNSMIAARIPVTAGIVVMGVTYGFIMAVICGVICGIKKNTWIDQTVSIFMLVLVSAPSFVIATLFLTVIVEINPSYSFIGTFGTAREFFSRLSLPAIICASNMVAMTGRVTRSSMIEQLKAQYVMTAKAKGLSGRKVIFKHAFRNAMIPVLTIATMYFGSMVASTTLVESVFSLAGIGSLLINAIQLSNYPIIQAVIMIMLTIYLVISLVTDILYAIIDPRVRQRLKK